MAREPAVQCLLPMVISRAALYLLARFGTDVRRYLLRVGDYHTGVREEFERELPIERIVLHRDYRSSSNDNDIALVRMQGKDGHCLSFSRHVLPVCLPNRKEKAAINRQACIISGWGDTGESGVYDAQGRGLKGAGAQMLGYSQVKGLVREEPRQGNGWRGMPVPQCGIRT